MEDLYSYMRWGNYDQRIEELSELAITEVWDIEGKSKNHILKKYLSHTFDRLKFEKKVIETDEYCLFNTGLFTKYYEEIYAYGQKEQNGSYRFVDFCTEYDLGKRNVSLIPQRADYFTNPELLIFDSRLPVRVQYRHILDDENNKKRLPYVISSSSMALQLLIGCIDTSIKRVIANYKLAIPQYYNGKIQLLVPIYFHDDSRPELALVLTKMDDEYYLGHTCITLDMAYNNARLITKPESNWLIHQNINVAAQSEEEEIFIEE